MSIHPAETGQPSEPLPPLGALLRRPAVVVRHHTLRRLHAAGFGDVLPAHLGVFQHPGPDGQRPGVLAMRTQASKQAMNHLLHQLETCGYIVRESHPDDRRNRVVKLTDRGRQAARVIEAAQRELEAHWSQALGESTYDDLVRGLVKLEALLEEEVGQ